MKNFHVISDLSRPGPELGRILQAFARNTREALNAFGDDPAECIHLVRTKLKKVRAMLCLAKSELPTSRLGEIQRDIDLLKNTYAPVRDAEVVAKLFGDLVRRDEATRSRQLLEPSAILIERPGDDLIHAADRLVEEISSLPFWAVTATGVERAFKKSQHRARVAGRRCHPDASDAKFHAWRKRVKALSIQATVLGSKREKVAEQLAEDLGDVNDLANLRHRLAGEILPDPLRHRIERNLAEARQKALHRGRKIY